MPAVSLLVLSVSIGDFVSEDEKGNPCERVSKQVLRSKYVGLSDAGVECDHLAFIQADADWQLWIDRGTKSLPRRIVITYENLPTEPQWEAVFSAWRFDRRLPASFCQPQIPKGAIKAGFITLKGA